MTNIIKYRTILAFSVLLVLITIGYFCVRASRTYIPSIADRKCNLSMLMSALNDYPYMVSGDKTRTFTNIRGAENNELISWRYNILPIVQLRILEIDITQPWNSRDNLYQRELCFRNMTLSQILKRTRTDDCEDFFLLAFDAPPWITYSYCYEHPYSFYRSTNDETTNIMAISGTGTLFDSNVLISNQETLPKNLVVLAEVSSNVHWTEPYDINVDDLKANCSSPRYQLGLKSDTRGFYVCFADNHIYYLKKNTPLELLGKLGTIEGAKNNDRNELLKEYILEQK